MPEKTYTVTIGTEVWIGRDRSTEPFSDYVSIHTKQPRLDREFEAWESEGYVVSHCYEDFKKVTGLTLRKGQLIGPVYLGVVE